MKFFSIILLCFLSVKAFAQISTDERPPSFDNPIIDNLFQGRETDLKIMPRLDMSKIQQEDKENEQKGTPNVSIS